MEDTESKVLKNYYTDNDFVLSAEGILKVVSVMVCIVSAVLFLGGAGAACSGAGGSGALAAGGAVVALAAAALLAVLYAGVLCGLPLYVPVVWLYTDIVLSAVMGVLLLLTAILSIIFCQMSSVIDYMHGPLSIVSAGTVTASAVTTFAAVTRRGDTARGPREPRRPPPAELDV